MGPRDGIKVTRLQFPVPATQDFLSSMFEKAVSPRTKVFHFTHITNLTAQLFPVQRLSRLARSKGIVTIVDGAPPNSVFDYQALRVSPNVYTTLEEIETFVEAMEDAITSGVPEAPDPIPAYPAEVTIQRKER